MSDQAIQQQILKELRELRGSFEDHLTGVNSRLEALEAQVSRLASAGAPGPVLVAANPRARKSRPS